MTIEQVRQKLPLPELLEALDLEDHAKKSALCPLHDDHNASFSIFETLNGWRWKCHAGCGSGDEIEFLARLKNIDISEATELFFQIAERLGADQKSTGKPVVDLAAPDITVEWDKCVAALTADDLSDLSTWRGYSPQFCEWLRASKLIGKFKGCFAFPLHREDWVVVGIHYRLQDATWRFHGRCKMRPLILGSLKSANIGFAFESQWDAFALLDRLGLYKNFSTSAVLITRGAKNGKLIRGQCLPSAKLLAFKHNDEEKMGYKAGDVWLKDVATKLAVLFSKLPFRRSLKT